jgi:hypothetical protein
VKMLVAGFYPIPIQISLLVIAVVLGAAIAASLAFPKKANVETG